MKAFAAVILAAGRGTRMKSDLPKAMQSICGVPMLDYLVRTVKTLRPAKIVVVAGFGFDRVREFLDGRAALAHQKLLLGSGHAVRQAEDQLRGFKGPLLVLYCDTPFISAELIRGLLKNHRERDADCTLLSVRLDNPSGYGRIKRASGGAVEKIVEDADAKAAEKAIREINVGCYVFKAKQLYAALKRVQKNQSAGRSLNTQEQAISAGISTGEWLYNTSSQQ